MRLRCRLLRRCRGKKTCVQREAPAIVGFALDEGKWDGIYLGCRKRIDLVFAGKVDHHDCVVSADNGERM
ncbi:hypothetical protein SE91_28215 [Bradyrhizobium sp. DOA1]|nr:hypothetical protein SE91_28215 [Bradyrhizobium sp. DOA1]